MCLLYVSESESEVAQSCPTLRPVDYSPPSSSIHGILQNSVNSFSLKATSLFLQLGNVDRIYKQVCIQKHESLYVMLKYLVCLLFKGIISANPIEVNLWLKVHLIIN